MIVKNRSIRIFWIGSTYFSIGVNCCIAYWVGKRTNLGRIRHLGQIPRRFPNQFYINIPNPRDYSNNIFYLG